ncbi:MAG TPA: glycosyltransferase family A protein [Vicinamibacterales bacterium]|nr:glycosyltransferase family A protein [Vicinamibacterales bacterium]
MPVRSTVSVVIPCHNQARYLKAALRSVADQTVAPFETIVVDDGSSDGSSATAAAAGATVVRLPHSGVSIARNRGLATASGTFVIFLDADDELEPDAIESGLAVLERQPDAWMVARCCVLVNSAGKELPTNCPAPEDDDLYGQWLGRNLVWTPGAAVIRRAPLLAIGGFPAGVGPAADYAVYLELARAGRVVFDPRVAVRYRQHEANMSRDAVRMLRATLTVLRHEAAFVPASHRRRFHVGRRDWCTFYGEQVIQQLRLDLRHRRLGYPQFRAMAFLLRECPHLMFSHVKRKIRRLLAGYGRAEVEGTRFLEPEPAGTEPAGVPAPEPPH